MGWRPVDVRYWHKADITAAFRFQDKSGHRVDLPPVRRNAEPERNGPALTDPRQEIGGTEKRTTFAALSAS